MTLTHPKKTVRRGFTLVEMLVVIVIIGVIMGLISAAVVKALGKGKEAQMQGEIRQLALAIENFKTKYGFYPPSQLILCEVYDQYFANNIGPNPPLRSLLHADSIEFLTRMFSRIAPQRVENPPGSGNWIWVGQWANTGIDWNGHGPTINPATVPPVTLEGDQCLVFFLGGIPNNLPANTIGPSCTGFSTNPNNPAAHMSPGGGEVTSPLFDFSTGRLGVYPARNLDSRTELVAGGWRPHRSGRHYSYADTSSTVPSNFQFNPSLGVPYAYFGSYKTANGYNRYFQKNGAAPLFYPYSDCPSLPPPLPPTNPPLPPAAVWPHAQSVSPFHQYLNSTTFQIICAGPDHLFGLGTDLTAKQADLPGLCWTPNRAPLLYPDNSPGHDDQTNFSSSPLGIGVQ